MSSPSSAPSPSPSMPGRRHPIRLETDGECLIIRNVTFKDGNEYDIRIWRYDDYGNVMYMDGNTEFLKKTIEDVRAIAIEMFVPENFVSPDLMTKTKIYFNNRNATSVESWEEDLTKPSEDPTAKNSILDSSGDPAKRPLTANVAKIHNLFFGAQTTAWSNDPNDQLTIKPKVVPKEEFPAPVASASKTDEGSSTDIFISSPKQKKTKKRAEVDSDDDVDAEPAKEGLRKHAKKQKLLPEKIEESTNSSPTAADGTDLIPTPEAHEDSLREVLDAAARDHLSRHPRTPEFLKGINYFDIADYAIATPKPKDDKLEKAYAVFRKILEKPNDDSSTDQEYIGMRHWLVNMYKAAYKKHMQMKAAFNGNITHVDRRAWSRHFAAKAIAGYILVPNTSFNNLEAWLENIDPTQKGKVPSNPPKKKWFGFCNLK